MVLSQQCQKVLQFVNTGDVAQHKIPSVSPETTDLDDRVPSWVPNWSAGSCLEPLTAFYQIQLEPECRSTGNLTMTRFALRKRLFLLTQVWITGSSTIRLDIIVGTFHGTVVYDNDRVPRIWLLEEFVSDQFHPCRCKQEFWLKILGTATTSKPGFDRYYQQSYPKLMLSSELCRCRSIQADSIADSVYMPGQEMEKYSVAEVGSICWLYSWREERWKEQEDYDTASLRELLKSY